ncbi:hypothetical protein Dimus_015181 [Dionaea muscipula]
MRIGSEITVLLSLLAGSDLHLRSLVIDGCWSSGGRSHEAREVRDGEDFTRIESCWPPPIADLLTPAVGSLIVEQCEVEDGKATLSHVAAANSTKEGRSDLGAGQPREGE